MSNLLRGLHMPEKMLHRSDGRRDELFPDRNQSSGTLTPTFIWKSFFVISDSP